VEAKKVCKRKKINCYSKNREIRRQLILWRVDFNKNYLKGENYDEEMR
jgi:hypothetical protein